MPGIEALAALVQFGTVSEAATRLRLTQSAVTKRLQALQQAVGRRLVEHEGRRLRLTEDARLLLDRARPLLARMLREEVAQFGHRSPAVTELLAKTDWEDAAWKNVRSADAARQAIDDALARRDPDYALRLVNLIRRSAPAWVDEAAVGLAVRELRAHLQLHQKPAAATQLRELVRRGGASRAAVRSSNSACTTSKPSSVTGSTSQLGTRPARSDSTVAVPVSIRLPSRSGA